MMMMMIIFEWPVGHDGADDDNDINGQSQLCNGWNVYDDEDLIDEVVYEDDDHRV